MTKPLINFKATNVGNAFILNSLAIAVATGFALAGNQYLEKNTDLSSASRDLLTVLIAFLGALVAFFLLNRLFGFGGGMLILGAKQPE